MRIDRINYQKVFPVGAYLTERIGFEATLEEGEGAQTAIDQLRQMAEDLHKAKYPHYYTPAKRTVDPPHREEPAIQLKDPAGPDPLTTEQVRVCALMKNAASLEALAKFKDAAASYGLAGVYMDHVKRLNQELLTQ